MKVLLNQDVPPLGLIGQIVDVADGYARNYLLPKRLASEPTTANIKRIEVERVRVEGDRIRRRQAMEAMAARLQGKEITLKRMANEVGHLYGSVSGRDIAEALAAEGLPVEPSEVVLRDPIRTLDKYEVDIRLATDVAATIQLWVVPEKGTIPLDQPPQADASADQPAQAEDADSETQR